MILNIIVSALINPYMIGLLLIITSVICLGFRQKKTSIVLTVIALCWLWTWGTNAVYRIIGYRLEEMYPPICAEEMPHADAIVVLGGGMGASTNKPYAEMWGGADRAWHAVRLYRKGKAPIIIVSGKGERASTFPLLRDFGVPEQAIITEVQARNTEENARYVETILTKRSGTAISKKPKILLVTSAWHMRRALLNFSQTELDVVPAATDHEAFVGYTAKIRWNDYWPNADRFARNSVMFKEVLGYWLYRIKYSVIKE